MLQVTAQESSGRVELGSYVSQASNGVGTWRGTQAQLWLTSMPRFTPILTFDRQTNPGGSRTNYSFLSYLNWTPTFYTVQGLSVAPETRPIAVGWPNFRYDVRTFWKLPANRNFVLSSGITKLDYGSTLRATVISVGGIYYRRKWIIESQVYVNQTRPGNLWSSSGMVTAMYGAKGKSWIGAVASGGRELYRNAAITPGELQFDGYTVGGIYRKWLSRNYGIVILPEYQEKLAAFRRFGITIRGFWEF